ncbi:hypothetical protein THOM_0382 [Trachipleistophora hominis]|uniref:Uncharacterized protein n=1 Tax=Trachipleistophora hominis TaxID=72359 RepID=L7JYZ7_TRAHO|nr:hypothetical protein THOM_0382 [Trachipleistophora hominis]
MWNALTPNDNVSFFRSSFDDISESKFSVRNVDDNPIVYDQEKFESLSCESRMMNECDPREASRIIPKGRVMELRDVCESRMMNECGPCEASRIIPKGRVMKLRDKYESYIQEAISDKKKLTEWESQHVHPRGKPESNKS